MRFDSMLTSLRFIQTLYLCLLLFSSLFYGFSFKFLYFTLPLASLCFPLLFLLAAIIADLLPARQCIMFLLSCSLVNYFLVIFLKLSTNIPLNEFWIDNWHTEKQIYGILSLGYHISLMICVGLVFFWRHAQYGYSFLTISMAAIIANVIDLGFMWPALFSYTEDSYLASWKLLTVATFKLNMLLLSLPIGWLLMWVHHYNNKHQA